MQILSHFFTPMSFSSIDLPAIAVFSFCAILFSFLDIKNGEIPRVFCLAMLCFVFILKVFIVFATDYTAQMVLERLSSTTLAGVFALFTFTLVFLVCRGKMGLADIWFSCGIGMLLGIRGFIVATLIACLLAFLWYGVLFLLKKGKLNRMSLPFIPFLSIGYFCIVLYMTFFIILGI